MYDGGYDARNVDFSRNNEIGYPSSLNNVICVAACTADEEQILSYSSLGTGIDDHMKPDVAAPTHFSCSYSPIYGGGSYGTSGATPFMAGILSCVLSTYEPDIKNIITHVIDSSIDRGSNGFDVEFGYGCVDALKLFDNYPNWWSSLRVDVLSGIVIICIGLIAIPKDEEEEKIPQYH
jgi:subtilisin family serine protease